MTCPFVGSAGHLGLEDNLDQAFAVAQVNEDHAAVVTAAVHPTRDHDLAPHKRWTDPTAGMGTPERAHALEARRSLRPACRLRSFGQGKTSTKPSSCLADAAPRCQTARGVEERLVL